MLAILQITAALLNLLPIPGLDGYGIVDRTSQAQTQAIDPTIAPYGFLLILSCCSSPP